MTAYGYCPVCAAAVYDRAGSEADRDGPRDTCAAGHLYLACYTLTLNQAWLVARLMDAASVVGDRLEEAYYGDPLTPAELNDLHRRCRRAVESVPLLGAGEGRV